MEGQHHGEPVEETPPGVVLTVQPPTCARIMDPRDRGTRIKPACPPGTSCRSPAACASASFGGPSAGAPQWGRSCPGMSRPPPGPATTSHTGHTTRGPVRGRRAAGRSGLECLGLSGRCPVAGPVVVPRTPPCGLGPGWAPRPHSGERPSPSVGRGACRRCGRVRMAVRHWWQGVRALGDTGPPHYLRRRPESARPEMELNRGATVRRRQGCAGTACIAARETRCPSPTILGHGRPVRGSLGQAGPSNL